jgi:hypothetical protein
MFTSFEPRVAAFFFSGDFFQTGRERTFFFLKDVKKKITRNKGGCLNFLNFIFG